MAFLRLVSKGVDYAHDMFKVLLCVTVSAAAVSAFREGLRTFLDRLQYSALPC
jgi:hypothetical protein